ncbi:MAG: glycosyltransferase [Lentisphaeria bacterium]
MRKSHSIYWVGSLLIITGLVALVLLLSQISKAWHLRGRLARSQNFLVTGDAFQPVAGSEQVLEFSFDFPATGQGLLLSLQAVVAQLQSENVDEAETMQDLQKDWGQMAGIVNIMDRGGHIMASAPLRLQHSLQTRLGSNLLPIARLPLLPEGRYQLQARINSSPQGGNPPEVQLHLACEVCSLEYLPLFFTYVVIVLLILLHVALGYKLEKLVRGFLRQREQEKWLSEGVGQAKIIYLLTHYPLWSETFLRQDLQLLLKEELPLKALALFPGDCEPQPDWPDVEILSVAKGISRFSESSKSRWQKLRRWIPSSVQCRLTLFRQRRLMHKLVRLGRTCHARHIHAEFADLGALLASEAAKRLEISYSIGVHAADVYTNQYSLERLCQGAKFITACNRAAGTFLVQQCPVAAKKLHLIHHGLDLDAWPYREQWKLSPVPKLLFVGRFVAKKGIRFLFGAVALLLQRKRALRLTLLGAGPLEEELRLQAAQLGIEGQLEWPGVVERKQVLERLQSTDIFCLPSIEAVDRNQEGIPNVLVEAMAVGVPVLGGQSGGIGELLSAETGWPLQKISAETLAEALEKLLQNPAECEKRRQQARHRVEVEFSAIRSNKVRSRLLEET